MLGLVQSSEITMRCNFFNNSMREGLAPLLLAKVESLQVKDFKASVEELISW